MAKNLKTIKMVGVFAGSLQGRRALTGSVAQSLQGLLEGLLHVLLPRLIPQTRCVKEKWYPANYVWIIYQNENGRGNCCGKHRGNGCGNCRENCCENCCEINRAIGVKKLFGAVKTV